MNVIKNLFISLKQSVKELIFLRRRDKSKDVDVDVILDNDKIVEYSGRLTDDGRFMHVPDMQRLVIKPRVHDRNNRKNVILPEKSHGKLNIEAVKNVANAQKYHILAKFKKAIYFDKTDFKLLGKDKEKEMLAKRQELMDGDEPWAEFWASGSMDFTLFNNDISPDFSADSFHVCQNNHINLLQDMPNYKLLLIIGFFTLFGFVIGNAHMFFWFFIYNLIT